MTENTLPDPDGKPVPARLPVRIAKAGAYAAGALLLAGAGVAVLCQATRTRGATRSMQLVWESRQQQMAEAAQAAELDNPVNPLPLDDLHKRPK